MMAKLFDCYCTALTHNNLTIKPSNNERTLKTPKQKTFFEIAV